MAYGAEVPDQLHPTLPSLLADVAGAVTGEIDLDRLLPQIVTAARESTGAQYGALGVLDPERERIVRFIHEGMPAETMLKIGSYPTGGGLLGELIRHPEPIVVDDLNTHPAFQGFPEHHPPMESFLGVPVRAAGAIFGNLYLTNAPKRFTHRDLSAVKVLAVLAGIAIHASKLATALRRSAIQAERDRISRDLHDGVIQALFSVGMGLEAARPLVHHDPDGLLRRMDQAVDQLDTTIREIRNTIFTLRPGVVDVSLERGLLDLSREYEVNAVLRPTVNLHTSVDPHVPEVLVPDVLNIVREAMSNAAKHASSPTMRLDAQVVDGELRIDVRDSGVGFDPAVLTSGMGLGNMDERADMMGGTLAVRTGEGEGTTVSLTVPLARFAEEDVDRWATGGDNT